MSIDVEKGIKWFQERKGKVSYSMYKRDGQSSYDCSSAVYYALVSGGATKERYTVYTETQHDWLLKNGYELIAENKDWKAQRGDIFIWGKRGYSANAGGHTGIFIDNQNIIHCNYSDNGISIGNHDRLWYYSGQPYFYAYRLKKTSTIKSGLYVDDKGKYFVTETGAYLYNSWKKISNKWYYFNKYGYALTNGWLLYKSEWYYFDKDGVMLSDTWLDLGTEKFYLNYYGVCELNYIKEIEGKTYAFDSRGALITDKKINSHGEII